MTSLFLLVLCCRSAHHRRRRIGWIRTGRYDEVETPLRRVPQALPRQGEVRHASAPRRRAARCSRSSPRADGMLTPEQPRAKKAPGGAASRAASTPARSTARTPASGSLRELLDGKVAPGARSTVTLVFVPVFNVDGHERFGPNHRPNQRGPEEMGWRVTAQNLNLNRDYVKADAPEMQAMLALLATLRSDALRRPARHRRREVPARRRPSPSSRSAPARPRCRRCGATLQQALFERARAPRATSRSTSIPSFVEGRRSRRAASPTAWPRRASRNAYWALQQPLRRAGRDALVEALRRAREGHLRRVRRPAREPRSRRADWLAAADAGRRRRRSSSAAPTWC